MSASEEINAKLDWLVDAVKYLLSQQGSPPPVDEDAWLEDGVDFDAEFAAAAAAVIPGASGCGHALTAIRGGHVLCTQCGEDLGCAHNQQAIVNGRVVCANCGALLGRSGVVGRDPNAPIPGQETHGPSAKNPGTPLVPYS